MAEDFTRPYAILNDDLVRFDARDQAHRVCHAGGEIAVAYDEADGVLHKHGEFNLVSEWFVRETEALRRHGFSALAETLVLFRSPFEPAVLAEVNRCIAVTGAVLGLRERMAATPDGAHEVPTRH